MKLIQKKNIFFVISSLIIIAGLVAMAVNHVKGNGMLDYGIEFSGGTELQINIGKEFSNDDVKEIVKEVTGDESPQIQKIKSPEVKALAESKSQVVIKTKSLDVEKREELFNAIKEKYELEDADKLSIQDISPSISGEMRRKAVQAVVIASFVILIYITFRFSDYKFGFAAILALLHDVLIVLAMYSLIRIPVNNSFVAAMLTIVGYSINDTIVVFDRIRENMPIVKKGDNVELVNRSVKQTFSRSLNTSLTTLFAIVMLYVIGVQSIKQFALPLIVGIISGTYSSIFIASPLWYLFKKGEKVVETEEV